MPTEAERSVLHVLPHPGGGGETYVDLLEEMPRYRFTRTYLAASPRPKTTELARGLAAAHRRGRAHDLVHVHGDTAAVLCIALLAMRPSVVTFNGLHLARRLTGVKRRVFALALRVVLRAADRTICVCNAERDYLAEAVGKHAARRAVVIHNGVRSPEPITATERTRIRAELGLDQSETVAIWVGSLDERKDPLAAMRGTASTSVTLVVVGDGPLRREVERQEFDRVHVLGHRVDVPRLLGASDIFLLTSHREGFALATLEAMAHGLVPVVTDLPENREAIGDAGIAVHGGSESLAAALRHLAADAEERAMLGVRASQRAARLFDAVRMTCRTEAIYDGLGE
jgi:glycosyltransferase involved in cell wall biosynthesis